MQLSSKFLARTLLLMVLINNTSAAFAPLIAQAFDFIASEVVTNIPIRDIVFEITRPITGSIITSIDTLVNHIPNIVRPYVKKVTDLLHVFSATGPTLAEVESAHYYDIAKNVSQTFSFGSKETDSQEKTDITTKLVEATKRITDKNSKTSQINDSIRVEADRIIKTLTHSMNIGFDNVEKHINVLQQSTEDIKKSLNNIENKINQNTILIENYIAKINENRELKHAFDTWDSIKRSCKQHFKAYSNADDISQLEKEERGILESNDRVDQFVNQQMMIKETFTSSSTFFLMVGDILDGRKTTTCDSKGIQWRIYELYLEIITDITKIMSILIYVKIDQFKNNNQVDKPLDYEKRKLKKLEDLLDIYQTYAKNLHLVGVDAYNAIKTASTIVRTCDPKEHVKGETYQNFVRIQQGYIGPTIKDDTDDPFIEILKNQYSTWVSLTDCTSMSSTKEIIVYSDTKNMERYFEFAEEKMTNGRKIIHGPKSQPNLYHPTIYDSIQIENENVQKCMINYEDEFSEHSVRFVSLQQKTTLPNYFVTGIRLKITNQILHLEIQQGKMSNGKIINDTIHWLPSSKQTVYNKEMLVDVSKINGFLMEDVTLADGNFLTGVGFQVLDVKDDKYRDIKLVTIIAQGQDLKTKSGVSKRQWLIDPPNDDNLITELKLNKPDSSIKTNGNVVLSTPGKHYIAIQVTDMTKDASQSMVPYLDIQELYAPGLMPFRGIGMYYRGTDGFGGFIGLNAFSHNISYLIDTEELNNGVKKIEELIDNVKLQKTSITNAIAKLDLAKKNLTQSIIKIIRKKN